MKLNTKRLTEVEVGQPVIEDGIYHCRLSAEAKENKKRTGMNLVLTQEILDEAKKRADGEPVKRSVKITRYISLVESDEYDPNENLKKLALALELPDDADIGLEDLQGAVVKCHVVYREADGEYHESNDVKAWYPKDADFINPSM